MPAAGLGVDRVGAVRAGVTTAVDGGHGTGDGIERPVGSGWTPERTVGVDHVAAERTRLIVPVDW